MNQTVFPEELVPRVISIVFTADAFAGGVIGKKGVVEVSGS